MNPRRHIAAPLLLATAACARSPARTVGAIDPPRAVSDAGAPPIVTDAASNDAATQAIASDAAAGGCGQGLLAAGSAWVVEREGSYEGSGCYGVGDPWDGRDVLRVRILDARGGRPMHVAVENEGATLATPDGGAAVADFAQTQEAPGCARLTRGVGGVEAHVNVDAWSLLDVFAAPCRTPSQKPLRADSTDALALRYRHALKLDEDDDSGTSLILTPRGMAERPFGRVRAFAVRGSILNGGAGMCHSWTTTLRGSGMLYLAEHEDVIVEASFQGTATTDEGSCMGCGPTGELRCPARRCARGLAKVTLQVRCE